MCVSRVAARRLTADVPAAMIADRGPARGAAGEVF